MEKITKHTKCDEENYIFTEEMNYFETGKESIWGPGDKETLDLLDT
ncbi:MAG: hypothetical protein JSW73_02540 [Candidatus Woesearchaeota archaeon]|nr:MAG: hypothetical protein JSW73_02540 [Candidatus Woesearchaeota archaeon]